MLTVTTPAASQDLTDVDAVKAALGISGTDDDDWLAVLVRQASGAIARFCNRTFVTETVTETFRLSRPAFELSLARFPVVDVTSIVADGETLDDADFEVDADPGILRRLDGNDELATWCGKVTVTYSAGFATIPSDVAAAAIALVRFLYHRRSTDPWTRSVVAGNINLALNADLSGPDGLPREVTSLLDPFRLPAVG
ncbi:MAG: hypothetical protein GC191_20560 [Azospirillum sp.]|nr:hypothetical protein [Azospirillum sp.]